jgi:hypothetical protein
VFITLFLGTVSPHSASAGFFFPRRSWRLRSPQFVRSAATLGLQGRRKFFASGPVPVRTLTWPAILQRRSRYRPLEPLFLTRFF